jgi:hypothetical protein
MTDLTEYDLSPDMDNWDIFNYPSNCCTIGAISAIVAPVGLAILFFLCMLYCPKVDSRNISCHGLSFWIGTLGLGFIAFSISFFALGVFDTISSYSRYQYVDALLCDLQLDTSTLAGQTTITQVYYISFQTSTSTQYSKVFADTYSESDLAQANADKQTILANVRTLPVWYDPARPKVVKMERSWSASVIIGLIMSCISAIGVLGCCGGVIMFIRKRVNWRKVNLMDCWDVCRGREAPAVDIELLMADI